MEIHFNWLGNFAFEADDKTGNKIVIDTTLNNGGENKGFSPMQLLLVGIGGCSAIDVIHILRRQRQDIESFSIDVEAVREKVDEYSVWKEITIHYKIKGKIDLAKAERAAQLSHEKYCSVSKALEYSSKINFTMTVTE
jgi:putative redox protein